MGSILTYFLASSQMGGVCLPLYPWSPSHGSHSHRVETPESKRLQKAYDLAGQGFRTLRWEGIDRQVVCGPI